MNKCRKCRFSEAVGKGQRNGTGEEVDVGVCRNKPPVVGPQSLPLIALDFDWCGNFERRWWWA